MKLDELMVGTQRMTLVQIQSLLQEGVRFEGGHDLWIFDFGKNFTVSEKLSSCPDPGTGLT